MYYYNQEHQTKYIIAQKKNFYKRLAILGFRTYDTYLQSEHWKEKKKEYFKEVNLPKYCIVCNSPYYQIHHMSYARLGRESVYDLIALCGKHHKGVHEFLAKNNMFLNATFKAIKLFYKKDVEKIRIYVQRKWRETQKENSIKTHRKGLHHNRSKAKVETTQERKKTKYGANTYRPNSKGMKPRTHPHTILVTDETWANYLETKGELTHEEIIKDLLTKKV